MERLSKTRNKYSGSDVKALVTMSGAHRARMKQGQCSQLEIVHINGRNRSEKSRRV